MDQSAPSSASPVASVAALLLALEERSRARPDRVLRLKGSLPVEGSDTTEAFELLIFRGFSSLTTHPTANDPDRPALPEGSSIDSAELLQAPLIPDGEILLAGPLSVNDLLTAAAWR